jgi:hypothetical protein
MAKPPPTRWWEIRPAHNRKPVTYRCPLCGGRLPALMDHALITPEGDARRRRHAGRLPTRDEYERTRRRAAGDPEPSLWRRLTGRGR